MSDHRMTMEDEIKRDGWMDTIRGGGAVKRWHARPIIGEQTVAAHTWGMLVIADHLFPTRVRNLVLPILYHDVVEKFTGDLPADAKWREPRLKELTDKVSADIEKVLSIHFELTLSDQFAMSICDRMEMLWFCVEQNRLGNTNMDQVFRRVLSWFRNQNLSMQLNSIETARVLDMLEGVYNKYGAPREVI